MKVPPYVVCERAELFDVSGILTFGDEAMKNSRELVSSNYPVPEERRAAGEMPHCAFISRQTA